MSVKVRCPGCEKVLNAPDTARGKAIRCPDCETKVKVPAGDTGGGTAKKKKAAAVESGDSQDAIASLDLRNMEDRSARICPKCGKDLQYLDEDETECPKCGFDTSVGGLGARAQKRRQGGPDRDKFYSGVWKANWKFAVKNQILAWRTVSYTLIASLLMFLCLFMYLYIPKWPPRIFFALCAFVAGMMIPGWLWFLDQELAVASLQKKDKLKRINFDFFLCSALGVKFLAWNAVFALPVFGLPFLFGYALTEYGGAPEFTKWLFLAIGYLPVLCMMPICIGHFIMPVSAPGWMVWKVFPAWLRTLKPTVLWVALTLLVHLPTIGCLTAIGVVYGPTLQSIATQMDENAAIARVKIAHDAASEKEKAAFADNPLLKLEYHKIDYASFIVPGVLWVLACVFLGFPALYSCRVNGQFLYFFRESLDLILLAKEYKYIAKEKPDEDEDVKPKTINKIATEAAVTALICSLLGLVGGMLFSAFSAQGNMVVGMLVGLYYGAAFAGVIGQIMLISAAFGESVVWGLIVLFVPLGSLVYVIKFWQEAAPGFFTALFGNCLMFFVIVLALAGVVGTDQLGFGNSGGDAAAQMAPEEAMPAEMAPAGGPEEMPAAAPAP